MAQIIYLNNLPNPERKLKAGLITTSDNEDDIPHQELAVDHTSEPIRKLEDIEKISNYLLSNGRYRDYMLFIVGINFGLRVSDLRQLRFCNLINNDLTFKETFPILEIKTRNTRRNRHNRYITINNAVIQAVTTYLEHTPGVSLNDYMFTSHSNNSLSGDEPLNRKSIYMILKGINDDLDLGIHMSTHTLRKTFGYHQMVLGNNDPRRLLLLSRIFGHSSTVITMDYIGITYDEIEDAYKDLNLGLRKTYMDSDVVLTPEEEQAM